MMQLMKYEEFKTELLNGIKACIPTRYSVELHRITKHNRTLDGICLLGSDTEKAVAPVIYADEFYSDYIDCGNIEHIAKTAADSLLSHFENTKDISIENAKNSIVPVLMSKDKLPSSAVHIPFWDMEIAFRWIMKTGNDGVYGTLITKEIAEAFGIDQGNLLEPAKINMKRLMPVTVHPLNALLREYVSNSDEQPVPAIILSNSYNTDGAVYILCDDVLKAIKGTLNRGFYIAVPCVHEAIIIPENAIPLDAVKDAVNQICKTSCIKPDEHLSKNVYHYGKVLKLVK